MAQGSTSQESAEWISREDLQRCALACRTSVERRVQHYLQHRWRRLRQFWCALKIAHRSFRGHIHLLLSRAWWGVDLGPQLQRSPDGHLHENKRTAFRSDCIAQLVAAHPWANSIDLDMFLQGFDLGEAWGAHTGISQRSVAELGSLGSLPAPRTNPIQDNCEGKSSEKPVW